MLNLIQNTFIKKCMKLIKEFLQETEQYKKQLSMGMSNDYEIALDYGATIVRIGTLLFKKC